MTAPDYAARMAVVREQAAKVAKVSRPQYFQLGRPINSQRVIPTHAQMVRTSR